MPRIPEIIAVWHTEETVTSTRYLKTNGSHNVDLTNSLRRKLLSFEEWYHGTCFTAPISYWKSMKNSKDRIFIKLRHALLRASKTIKYYNNPFFNRHIPSSIFSTFFAFFSSNSQTSKLNKNTTRNDETYNEAKDVTIRKLPPYRVRSLCHLSSRWKSSFCSDAVIRFPRAYVIHESPVRRCQPLTNTLTY